MGNRIFRVFVAIGIAYAVYELHEHLTRRMRELLHRFGEHILSPNPPAEEPGAGEPEAAAAGGPER